MRLALITRASSTGMRWDVLVAVALTFASFGSLSKWATQLAAVARGLPPDAESRTREQVTYIAIAPTPARPTPHVPATPRVRRTRTTATTAADEGPVTSPAAPMSPEPPVRSADSAAGLSVVAAPASRASARSSVFLAPSAFTRAPIVGYGIPLNFRYLPPTQDEKDSAARAFALEATLARNEGRPMPIPMSGSGGIGFGLFSRGPSRAQRVKDSIIYAQNLAMLRRLQQRVKAKQDSSRTADSSKPGSKPPTA